MPTAKEYKEDRANAAAKTQEDLTRLNLDRARLLYQADQIEREAEQEEEEAPQAMGWGIFIFAFMLTGIQLGIEWMTLGIFGWILAAPISVLLWFMLRPYTKRLKGAKLILNSSLVLDALPFVGLFPVDMLAIVYVFLKNRKELAAYLARIAEKRKNSAELIQAAA